jgi:hypothetical protein
MRIARGIILLLFLAIIFSSNAISVPAIAQSQACPLIAQNALEITEQVCAKTGRNQICYGHDQAAARPQPQVENLAFDAVGDIVDVTEVQSLRLSAMDVPSGIWGVVMMRLQASLPDTQPDKNVTLLLFGDVEVDMAATENAPVPDGVTVTTLFPVAVRQAPSSDASVVGQLASEQTVKVIGRLADNSWLRVWLPTGEGDGWVYASFLDVPEDLWRVEVVSPTTPTYRSLNAFYLRTGMDDASCPEAPNSGLLIQTPEGVGEVTLLINEVNIQLGSTVFVQAMPGHAMVVDVVEGSARVEVNGMARTAVAGTQMKVPINEKRQKTGPPARLEPYEPKTVQALPVKLLEKSVSVPPPLDEAHITVLNNTQEAQQPNGSWGSGSSDRGNGGPLQNVPIGGDTSDDSTADDSTVDDSDTSDDSTADDSTVDDSTADDSAGDDSTADDSDTGDDSTANDSAGDDTTADDSDTGDDSAADDSETGDDSTADDSAGDDSTADDSNTADDTTVDDSTVDDSAGDDSTVDDSDTGNNSAADDSDTGDDTTVDDSTVDDSAGDDSTTDDGDTGDSDTSDDSTADDNASDNGTGDSSTNEFYRR